METRNLGHSGTKMDDTVMQAFGHDLPNQFWVEAGQFGIQTPYATTIMAIQLPNQTQVAFASPKDGKVNNVKAIFDATGAITDFEVDGIEYSASDPTVARATLVEYLVDYAKQMSADRRDEFIEFIKQFNPAVAAEVLTGVSR